MGKYILIIILTFLSFSFTFNLIGQNKDYALFSEKDAWSHHVAYGSPSWDTFERFPNNPVYRGRKGMEWPVNGFLYADPISKKWFLYVGEYKENYQPDQDSTTVDFNCVILQSNDKGKTWKKLGDLFPKNLLCYGSKKIQVPDVMVTYSDGKYHMVFDWLTNQFNWENAEDSGIGYAVSDKPEGPFVVSSLPIKHNSEYKKSPLLGKYWRMYAAMIIKRKNDWVLSYMMDIEGGGSWALATSTASKPEGPYSEAKIIMNTEKKTNFSPMQEFFPSFTHEGYVYFPSSSVAANRNYQSLFRAKIENMTDSDKYETVKMGAFWHSENVENEHAGIWGQTMTGFIDDKDSIYVMFPSKDPQNYGTINLAKASWKNLDRKRGFNLAGNEGSTFSYLKKIMDVESIDMKFNLDGTMRILFDYNSPFDYQNFWAKFSLTQNTADYKELVINKSDWKINVHNPKTGISRIDSGKIQGWNTDSNTLQLKREFGKYKLTINGQKYWEGQFKSSPGLVGIALDPRSYLFADNFVVEGAEKEGYITYGFYEALVNAGNHESDWDFKSDSIFFNGKGTVSKKKSSAVKWTFEGKAFELLSPLGPQYGKINVYLDGKLLTKLSLKNTKNVKSNTVFKSSKLSNVQHTVFIESVDGLLPVDCIRVSL